MTIEELIELKQACAEHFEIEVVGGAHCIVKPKAAIRKPSGMSDFGPFEVVRGERGWVAGHWPQGMDYVPAPSPVAALVLLFDAMEESLRAWAESYRGLRACIQKPIRGITPGF